MSYICPTFHFPPTTRLAHPLYRPSPRHPKLSSAFPAIHGDGHHRSCRSFSEEVIACLVALFSWRAGRRVNRAHCRSGFIRSPGFRLRGPSVMEVDRGGCKPRQLRGVAIVGWPDCGGNIQLVTTRQLRRLRSYDATRVRWYQFLHNLPYRVLTDTTQSFAMHRP